MNSKNPVEPIFFQVIRGSHLILQLADVQYPVGWNTSLESRCVSVSVDVDDVLNTIVERSTEGYRWTSTLCERWVRRTLGIHSVQAGRSSKSRVAIPTWE